MYCGIDVEFVKTLCGVGFKKIPCVRKYPRMIKSLFVVYCNIMFHVAEAKIIRHKNKAFHNETLAHFSVPKRKSAGKKGSIVALRSCQVASPVGVCSSRTPPPSG